MVSGTATIVEEGAFEHINMLAKKHLGEDKYPYLGPAPTLGVRTSDLVDGGAWSFLRIGGETE
jgi:hypothetical protein